jgi:predicted O-linked N-acetylglucosamine transferase (SPINDLY family)
MPVERPPLPPDPHAATLVEAAACMARGDLARAAVALDRVLAASPAHPAALFQRAVIEVAGDRPGPAADLLARCVAAQPGWAEAWVRLGQLRLLLGEDEAAEQAFRAAAAGAPTDVRAFEGLAEALRRRGRDFAGLVRARMRLAELEPRVVEHRLRLGYTLRGGDLADAAEAAYRDALAIDPGNLVARWSLFQNPPTVVPADEAAQRAFAARWSEGLAWFEALDPARRPALEIEQALLTASDFALHYQPGHLRAERCRYADLLARLARAAIPAPKPAPRPAGTRRRIALVSAFFRRHSVTRVLGGLLEALHPERFELGFFHLDPREDADTARWRARASAWVGGTQRPAQWLQAIADFAPDAVVYLDIGMDPLSQVLACFRLAPLQLALWGHPLTTGHAAIDHFVSADLIEVPDPAAHYREQLHRLPNLGTRFEAPTPAPRAARDHGEVHYLLAQMVLKITPAHDELLARIAAALPQARFTVVPGPRAHVCEALAARIGRAFAARGLDAARQLRVIPNLPAAEFAALAASMDVNLDTIGWSGGVSTFDLLAQGLPTVTVEGDTFRGRQSAAILRRAGVADPACADADAYVDAAIALGRERGLREHLRERLLAGRDIVFDDPAPPAAFADLLERLVPAP